MKLRKEEPALFGVTSAQIALTLVLNGWDVDEAMDKAGEFGARFGHRVPDVETVREMLSWAKTEGRR